MPDLPFTPDVDEVGVLISVRTVDANGAELGTFSGETRPTASQVVDLCEIAAADVAARLVVPVPDAYVDEARRLSALNAATLVLNSYYPEAIANEQAGYAQITAMFLQGVAALQDALRGTALRLP